jgi:AcrR family transcriptional regulator
MDRYKMDHPPRRRGRPRLLDREAGLETAAKLFWRHGYEGTSIADLTQAMGISPPSLYATFGSKENLYREAVAYASEQGGSRLALLKGDASAYDGIAFYLHEVAREFANPALPPGCMVATAVLQHAQENEAAAGIAADQRAATARIIQDRLDRAVAEGELPEGADTFTLTRFYMAVMQGMSAQACDGTCAETLRRMADMALSVWPGQRQGT